MTPEEKELDAAQDAVIAAYRRKRNANDEAADACSEVKSAEKRLWLARKACKLP
jgi:hypothetical protein